MLKEYIVTTICQGRQPDLNVNMLAYKFQSVRTVSGRKWIDKTSNIKKITRKREFTAVCLNVNLPKNVIHTKNMESRLASGVH